MNLIIYKVTSPSGKVYVGKTSRTLQERKLEHERKANNSNSKSYNTAFSRCIRKYGKLLKWEILCNIDNFNYENKNLEERVEQLYIFAHRSYISGYNSTKGGEGGPGYKHNLESIHKMSSPRNSFPWKNNINATIYTIQSPNNEIFYFSGRKELESFFKDKLSYLSLIKRGKNSGWKVLERKKINA
jgi:hypothetical protein